MAVAIVTDSTSDIEPARAAALGVVVVPLMVLFGDRSFRDYVDLTRSQFYAKLASEAVLPTTSQPTAAMFEEAFRPIVARGDEILCIVVSSKLSGTINAARAAASVFPGATIEIVDSESAAGGLGMQILLAQELRQKGATLDEIAAALAKEEATQRLYACVPDLSHLQRNGRIGKAQALIGSLMKIVPVLRLKDGEVAAEAQVRTMTRARQAMLDLTLQNTPDVANARYLVMHTNALELAQSVLEELRVKLGGVEPKLLDILEAGPVIAVHAGPGAVGIFSAQD
jgi:DegV family protein with EDD domain